MANKRQQCVINVYDRDFNWIAETQLAPSVQLYRELYAVGTFTVRVSVNDRAVDALTTKNNIIVINGDPRKSGITRGFTLTENRAERYFDITGVSGSGLLSRRISMPPTEAQVPGALGWDRIIGPAETVLKHYADRNIGPGAFDPKRAVARLIIAHDLGRGDSIPAQLRFTPLDEDMNKIAQLGMMGFEVRADYANQQWVFDVIPGVDRSVNQADNDPVALSVAFQNLSGYKYTEDYQNYRNCGYAGGAGDDEKRLVYIIGADNTGVDRWETFLDCGNIGLIDDLLYYGNLKMADFAAAKTLDADARQQVFKFGEEYDLGDIVTAKIARIGLALDARVEGVTEVWERDSGYLAKIRLGNKVPNAFTMLKQRKEVT